VPSYSLAKNLQKNVFTTTTTTTVSSQTEYLQVIRMNSGFLRSYAQVRFHAFPNETKHFSFLENPRLTLRPTQPPIQRVPVSLSQGVLRPGREADRSLAPSGNARNARDLVPPPTD